MSTQDWAEDAAAEPHEAEWEERHDETSGAAYFFNTRTGESSWDAPTASHAAAAREGQWTEVFDESRGCIYYVNLLTSETRWDPPPGYAANNVVGAAGKRDEGVKRPSTAEQMEKLNQLLSGDDDEEDEDREPHEIKPSLAPQTPSADVGGIPPQEMPWMMFLNESDGIPYYYNHVTGECVWGPPEDFVVYHQQQQQQEHQEDHSDHHQQDQHHAVETEAEIAQRESARSGMRNTTAAAGREPPLVITPEFEEKVRRAIENVSKTPVGSSRVLFVRTPSEKWPEFVAKNDGDGNEEAPVPPTSSRMATTPRRPRSSRPGSALSGSSRPRTPQPAVISEHAVQLDGERGLGANQADGTEDDEAVGLGEAQPSKLVESYDPETGTFMHVVEPISSLEEGQQQQHKQGDLDHENDKLIELTMQLRFEEAAIVIECLVRCFLARHRVQKQRRVKEKEAQRRRESESPSPLVTSDNNNEQQVEVVSGGSFQVDEDVVMRGSEPSVDRQESDASAVLGDSLAEADSEAVGLGTQASDADDQPMSDTCVAQGKTHPDAECMEIQGLESTDSSEDAFAEADAAVPTDEATAVEATPANTVESSPQEEQGSLLQPPISSARSDTQLYDAPIDQACDAVVASSEPRPSSPSTVPVATKTEPMVEFQEPVATAGTMSLSHKTNLRAEELTAEGVLLSSPPENLTEAELKLPSSVAKQKTRPTSSSSSTSRAQKASSSSSSSSAPRVLDIAQFFTRRASVKVSAEPGNSTAPVPASIVRKRVELLLKANVRPATLPEAHISAAVAERKQQQIQAASAARARTKELLAQEVSEFRLLYQTSAAKHAIEKQQVLNTLRVRSTPAPSVSGPVPVSLSYSNLNEHPQSIWQLLLADVAATATNPTGNHEPRSEGAFQARVAQLLDPATLVSTMEKERMFELHQRLERLQMSNHKLDSQLEAIDLCLLQEDHFPHPDSSSSAAVAANRKTFQAKYASKLRRRQNELLRAIEFWQQQVAAFHAELSIEAENNAVTSNSIFTVPASYWDRVHQHYNKLTTNQETLGLNRALLSLRDANGDSLLHLAGWKGRESDVARLLALASGDDDERIALANLVDNTVNQCRPLHDACRGGHVDIARMLVAAGAKLDVVDSMGDSPLHVACRLGWTQIVHFLLTVAAQEEDTLTNILTNTKINNNNMDKKRPEVLSCSLSAFFHLRNRKQRRAMDLVSLPSLIAFLQRTFCLICLVLHIMVCMALWTYFITCLFSFSCVEFERELPHESEHGSELLKHKKTALRSTRKRSKSGNAAQG